MRKICYFIIMFFCVSSFVSAKNIDRTRFSAIDNSIIMDIVETSDGGYFGVGSAMPTDNSWAFPARYAVKLDKSGKIEWEYRDNYIFSLWVKGEETSDGSYVAVGSTADPSSYNIVKFDKDGNVLWEDTGSSFEIENHYIISDYSDFVIDSDGYVAVGTNQISWYENNDPSTMQKNDTDGLIIKYDLNGNILWKNNFNLNYYENYNSILLLDDGTYLVTGSYKSSEEVDNLPATDNYCGLAVNYSKNGNILSKKVYCENDKSISFGKVVKYGDRYYVDSVIADDKYVYIFDDNYNYISSYNLSDSEAVNSFFYIYNDLFVWVNVFGSDIPYVAEINFFDKDLNLIGKDEIGIAFNINVFNFLINSNGNLVISDIIYNQDYANAIDMFVSEISFYKVLYEVQLEQSIHGNFQVEQEGELGKIIVTPDEGYVLDAIKIVDAGGRNKEYYEEDGNYYFGLEDGLVINVTYKEVPKNIEDVKNPETVSFSVIVVLFLLIISTIGIFLLKNKRNSLE